MIFHPKNVRFLSPFSLKLVPLKGLFAFGSFLKCSLFNVFSIKKDIFTLFYYVIQTFLDKGQIFTELMSANEWLIPKINVICQTVQAGE